MQGSFVNQAQNNQTLTLSSGETLIARKRLTAGERRAALAAMSVTGPDGRLRINPLMIGLGTILAYLKAWTVTDDHGQIVPFADESLEDKIAILNDMDDEEFAEIRMLIDAHEQAMLTERAEKKAPEWRDRILSDAALAVHYRIDFAAVADLDADVYDVLVEDLIRQRTPPPPPEDEEDDTPLWPARR